MNKKPKILLIGPQLLNIKSEYGGGIGGYTRNFKVYLDCLNKANVNVVPCFQSVRVKTNFLYFHFVIRFLKDIFYFLLQVIKEKPNLLHILAQYRFSTPREFMMVVIGKSFKKKIVYEIKAGSFIDFYSSTNIISKRMINYIINNSDLILLEGEIYCPFFKEHFPTKKIDFFPNFVPIEEIPKNANNILNSDIISILFVGYIYEGKGVFELIKGCNLAAENGVKINLIMIGQQDKLFQVWIENYKKNKNLNISFLGTQPHNVVEMYLSKVDMYIYPSKHLGEGHNNSINEALMYGLLIISSKNGFLDDVLNDCCYFINTINEIEICEKIITAIQNKELSKKLAKNGRDKLINLYSSDEQIPRLINNYTALFNNKIY